MDFWRKINKSILIVDDNVFNIDVIVEILQAGFPDYELKTCFSGKEALQIMRERMNNHIPMFGLMIFDINMPEMNGFVLEQKAWNLLFKLIWDKPLIAALTA